ncbi:hypothetical protein [Actinomadura sp. B10D3]|uniref:alpha-L-rhamnosidase-related protein n=1 Tax=Actinomadura sp. B10D3 TaxID=3153557 RepID=UPI00325C4289
MSGGMSRRRFLEASAAGVTGAVVLGDAGPASATSPAGAPARDRTPSGLLTSLLPAGLGVTAAGPRLSWQVADLGPGTKQTHYQVQFAGSSSTDFADLVDWPVSNRDGYVFTEVNTVVNACQYAAFTAMADIADVLGKTADARSWRGRAGRLAAAMRENLLDASNGRFLDGVGTTHSAQHATAYPVALGVASPGTVPDPSSAPWAGPSRTAA